MAEPEAPYPWPARIQLYFRARRYEVTLGVTFERGIVLVDDGLAGAARGRKLNREVLKSFAATPKTAATPRTEPPGQSAGATTAVAPALAATGTPSAKPTQPDADPLAAEEARWRALAKACREKVEEEELLLRQEEAKVQDPRQLSGDSLVREALEKRNEGMLAYYKERVARARQKCDDLVDECRKAGCFPGWIR